MLKFARKLLSSKHREFLRLCDEMAMYVVYSMPTVEEIAKRLITQEDEPTTIKPFTDKILLPSKIQKEVYLLRELQNTYNSLSPYKRQKYGKRRLKMILKRTYKLAVKIKKYYDRNAYRTTYNVLNHKEIEENWLNEKFHFGMWLGCLYVDEP